MQCWWQEVAACLTSSCMSEILSVLTTSPVRGLMISTMMGAPHLAFNASPDKYFEPKQLVHRRCCACLHSSQSGHKQPMLLHRNTVQALTESNEFWEVCTAYATAMQ